VRRRRHELASSGFDDFLANLGGHNTGLRIPAAAIGAVSMAPIDYLFLLDSVDLLPGDVLVGIAQYLSIAAPQVVAAPSLPTGPAPSAPADPPASPVYPFERQVLSPLWRFPDTFTRWILTLEGKPPPQTQAGAFDSDSFIFQDATSPALVYETVHFPAVPLAPGYLGLDDYTAPGIKGSSILEVRDLRYPWTDESTFRSLREPQHHTTRARFYLKIRQSDPSSRMLLPIPNTAFFDYPGSFDPEDGYLVASQTTLTVDSAQYWRCAGRILIDRGFGREED